MIDQGRSAAIKLGEWDVQVEGLAVMLEALKAGDGNGTLKQDNVRMGTEIVDDAIDLVNGQSINPEILIPGIMIDKDNVGQYLPKSQGRRKARGPARFTIPGGFVIAPRASPHALYHSSVFAR